MLYNVPEAAVAKMRGVYYNAKLVHAPYGLYAEGLKPRIGLEAVGVAERVFLIMGKGDEPYAAAVHFVQPLYFAVKRFAVFNRHHG